MSTSSFVLPGTDRRHPSPLRNRWTVAAAGTVMMMCLGTVYSWSVYARPLMAAFHWSVMTTMWAFSIAIFSLGIGAVVGGRAQDRIGPRTVAIAGVFLWSLGNLLAGMFTAGLGVWWLYLTYGVIGGFGLGMGYVSPVAMVTKWFPDHRGAAGGLVVTGFGMGAFFYNGLVQRFPGFAHAAASASTFFERHAAMSYADVHAVMGAFTWSGLAFLAVGGACSLLLCDPPEHYGRRRDDPVVPLGRQYRPSEVLRTPQFYLLWAMLFCSVTAGILVISNAVPIFTDLTGSSPTFAAMTVGALALFNGIGRIAWGAISDRIGRNLAYGLILGLQAATFALMPQLHGVTFVAAAFAVVLCCNGGSFGTMPAFNADFFGTKYMGLNYGLIITAWGCAGVAGPLLAAHVKDVTGTYTVTLIPVAIMLLAATALPALARRPGAAAAHRPARWCGTALVGAAD
ncbi:MAG TPA: OFA family MFS transporter [Candidatus Baltobacteraceae bacterium]|nr:OFA family MFS transporter [Candidatus Baltobacteraceae bacterium]